jgi:preprotein translocase subunit SecA
MRDIQGTFAERFLKVQVTAEPQRRPAPPPPPPSRPADDLFPGEPAAAAARRSPAVSPPLVGGPAGARAPMGAATVPEVGRNDPCPCGSGKKYKKCHGANR